MTLRSTARWGWILGAGLAAQAIVQLSLVFLALIGRGTEPWTVPLLTMLVTVAAATAVATQVKAEEALRSGSLVGLCVAVTGCAALLFGSLDITTPAFFVLTVASGSLGGRLATLDQVEWDL
jgi:hypothetical protein